jgi:predicted transcriptional regulator
MEVNIGPDLQAKLARLVTVRGRDTQALVQQVIERFVDYEEWFLREVEKGLAAADRDELIDHEEIGKLINRRYPVSELARAHGFELTAECRPLIAAFFPHFLPERLLS